MITGLDRHEHGDPEPELVLVDNGYPPLDDPLGFQALDALPAGRRGETNPVSDLGHRKRCILLQNRENLPINGVHGNSKRVEQSRFDRTIFLYMPFATDRIEEYFTFSRG